MVTHELSSALSVKQFSYRTALVGGHFLKFDRRMMHELEEALAAKAGVRPDNHTVYEVVYNDFDEKKTTYIWFVDTSVIFGSTVEMRRH